MSPGDSRGPVATRATDNTTSPAATVPQATDTRAYERGFCDGWRDRADYGRRARLTFDDGHAVGFAAGYWAASRAVNNAIAEATQGMPADAAEVVHRLVATWERGAST